MQISFSMMEYMSIATLVTGTCWLIVRTRKSVDGKKGGVAWLIKSCAELFGVIALVLFCRVALADWQHVPSGSMEPTLRVGDRILVNKLAYGPRLPFTNTAIKLGQPERGDVVVFRYPGNVSEFYVKRLVGLPNDLVTYSRGVVRINDQPFDVKVDSAVVPKAEDRGQIFVDETAGNQKRIIKLNVAMPGERITPIAWMERYAKNCVVISSQDWQCKVPEGKYLMMGDNRDNSVDSRVWGFLDEYEVYGKVTKVIFNLSDMRRSWMSL